MSDTVCPHCGKTHRLGARFCNATGKLIDGAPPGTGGPGTPPASWDVGQISSIHPETPPQAGTSPGMDAQRGSSLTPGMDFTPGMTGKLPSNYVLKDHYLIVRKVGQGGMAAVYQVVDTWHPGVSWAVKEMSDAAISSNDREFAVRAFLTEANLLRTLHHPNLPQVIDAFNEGGKHYLVMEFVAGRSLQDLLQERKTPFSEAEVLGWSLQLCDVLAYLHSREPKIIFRDIKPSNIMVTPEGRIKLVDFGIARFFKPGQSSDTMALGTPGYAAPEAISGQTDERSDIYGLCITLHQLLTRFDPAADIFNPPQLRAMNPAVSNQMERVVMRGISFRREARWASVSALRDELVILERTIRHPPGAIVQPAGYPSGAAAALKSPPPAVVRTAGVAPTANVYPGSERYTPTNRPTTRLLMTARRMSTRQLVILSLVMLALIILATWILTPVLDALDFNWNYVPIVAIFGALGFATLPRRGITFAAHVIFSMALVGIVWLQAGSQGYSWTNLLTGAAVSGVLMELWIEILPWVKRRRAGDETGQPRDQWGLEVAWLSVMAAAGSTVFYWIVSRGLIGVDLLRIAAAALLGAVGWFLGDMVQQIMLHQTGRR